MPKDALQTTPPPEGDAPGAEGYSVEEILAEFAALDSHIESDTGADAALGASASPFQRADPSEREPLPEFSFPETVLEPVEELADLEEPAFPNLVTAPPAEERPSQADLAEVIAEAVATTVRREQDLEAPLYSGEFPEEDLQAKGEEPAEPEESPRNPDSEDLKSEQTDQTPTIYLPVYKAPEEKKKPAETAEKKAKNKRKKKKKAPKEKHEENKAPKQEPEDTAKKAPAFKETRERSVDTEKQPLHPPGHTKPIPKSSVSGAPVNVRADVSSIPRGSVHVSFFEVLAQSISDIRARQREDLPENHASLKSSERSYARLLSLNNVLTPVRYVIIVLMLLAIGGRSYRWMTLGFLGGESGIPVLIFLAVVSMLLSWHCIIPAVRDLGYLRASYGTLLLLTTVLSILETYADRNTASMLPFLTMSWCFIGMSDLMKIRGRLRSLRTVITGKHRTGVRVSYRRWKDSDCIGKAHASTAGFVRHQEERDTLEAGYNLLFLPVVAIALVVSAYLTAREEGGFLYYFTTMLAVSIPVSATLCCAKPYELFTRNMHRNGAIAGWFGMKALSGKKLLLINDSDLFPRGCITHKGVKVYGNQTPQLLVSYGASLIQRVDNGLTEPFGQLLRELGGQIYRVNGFQVTEGGVSGRINGVDVSVGSYPFMQLLGYALPDHAPRSGLFIAINGQVAGLFAIRYRIKAGSVGSFVRLTRQRRLTMVAALRGFTVNPSYMNKWFKVPVGRMICPKVNVRWKLSKPSAISRGVTCAFLNKDGISPYSSLVVGARRCYFIGLLLTLICAALSVYLLLITAIALISGGAIISGGRLLLYQIGVLLAVELGARFANRG